MAQTEHLPIYKASYDLCLYLEQVVQHFDRYHKYAIGADLRDGARRILRLVVRANSRRDKAPVLFRLREEIEELKVLLRLCHDTKGFPNFNSFEHSVGLVTDIARQTLRYAPIGATRGDREFFPAFPSSRRSRRIEGQGPGQNRLAMLPS